MKLHLRVAGFFGLRLDDLDDLMEKIIGKNRRYNDINPKNHSIQIILVLGDRW